MSDLRIIAKRCAEVIDASLRDQIASHSALRAHWPVEADEYDFLDEVFDDIIEAGNPATTELFRPLLQKVSEILQKTGGNPDTLRKAIEEVYTHGDAAA